MDKTLELIVAATVFVLVGTVLMFMISGQGTDFKDFVDDESKSAQCTISEQKYRSACCGGTPDISKAKSVYKDADSSCDLKNEFVGNCNQISC